jgi:hypothetical protein
MRCTLLPRGALPTDIVEVASCVDGAHQVQPDRKNPRDRSESGVMPTELEQLHDLAGYLKLASRPQWLSGLKST